MNTQIKSFSAVSASSAVIFIRSARLQPGPLDYSVFRTDVAQDFSPATLAIQQV